RHNTNTISMLEEKLKILPTWMFTFLIMDFVIVMIIILAVSKNDDSQETIKILSIIGSIFTVIILLLYYIHFKVKMEYKHFSVKLVPFAFKPRIIAPEDIVSWNIRPCRAMREFSGFGKRKKGNATAYIVDSKFALEFDMKEGNKVVVSIGDKEKWQSTLERSSVWAEKRKMD